MTVLLIATTNPGKVREVAPLLEPVAGSLGLDLEPVAGAVLDDVAEDRDTFAGNAVVKALAAARRTGAACLAEDSGLEVDALGGLPGVHSARFSGGGDAANNRLLLERLAGVPAERRTARFRTVAALKVPDGPLLLATGTAEGAILTAPRGAGGFGYDPLFLSADLKQSFAEVPRDIKSRVSHRSRALRALRGYLFEFFDPPPGAPIAGASAVRPNGGELVPGHRECWHELVRAGLPSGIVTHSLAVARVARELAASVREAGGTVDLAVVVAAALLHDIGKRRSPGTGDVADAEFADAAVPAGVTPHAWASYQWVSSQGYAAAVARSVLVHGLDSLVSKEYFPATVEERIVTLADKLTAQSVVGLEERLRELSRRYPRAAELISAGRPHLVRIEREVGAAAGIDTAELIRRARGALGVVILPPDAGAGEAEHALSAPTGVR